MADEGHPSIRMSSSSKLCVTADGSKMDLKYFKAEVLGLFSLALQLLQLLLRLLVSLGSIGFIQLSYKFLARSPGFLWLFCAYLTV